MRWIKKGTIMEYVDSEGKVIKSYDTNIYQGIHINPEKDAWMDGYRSNNFLRTGQAKHVEKAIQLFLETGVMPDKDAIGVPGDRGYENVVRDARLWLKRNQIDENTYSADPTKFLTGKKTTTEEVSQLNPYAAYLEEQRQRQENAELGLLNKTSDANIQNAEISAQQAMIQQAQLKDQLIEQIKTDRLAKMRSGLTPMQIAQEDLQFMVGNIQGNNQNMQMVNQQRLMAQQQKSLNPYQAFINSNAAITGQQGYGNVASGLAATDAGDLYQQALRIARAKGRTAPSNDDFFMAQGQKQ